MPAFVKNTADARVLPGQHRHHRIAFAQSRRREVLDLLLPLDPPIARDDDDVVLLDDEVVGGVFDLAFVGGELGAPRIFLGIGVRLLHLLDLLAHDLPAIVFALEQPRDLPGALALLGELVGDDEDLEPRQPVDLQLEDRVRLLGVELEPLHDSLRGVGLAVRLADDAEDLVERVEDLLEPLEDVDAPLQRLQLVFEPRGDDVEPELQEVPEHLVQIEPLGPADLGFSVGTRQVRLTGTVVCSGVCFQRYAITSFGIDVALQRQLDAHVVGRDVLHVDERRQLARQDHLGDALDERRLVHHVRDAGDVDRLAAAGGLAHAPRAAHADRRRSLSCRFP